jgi:hypothetical protein
MIAVHLAMAYFQYSPLADPSSEIRLAILQPGKTYESVHCELITVPSVSAQSFEALSYCWGTTPVTNTIFVNGKSHQVRPNLEHALRHLRKKASQRTLWIDAICINQADIPEKNKQVPRMKWIYNHASEVIIWIGKYHEPEDDDLTWKVGVWGTEFVPPDPEAGTGETTHQAFTFAYMLASIFQIGENRRFLESFIQPILDNPYQYANLSRLLRREWFHRLWTIQEVVLAKKAIVICGSQSLEWGIVELAAQGIMSLIDHFKTMGKNFYLDLGFDRVYRITQCHLNRRMVPLIRSTQASEFPTQGVHSSDPRDRLFGLMGIAEDAEDIEPDYSQEHKEMYRSWVSRHIIRSQSLDALSLCADSTQYGFPSWVPDLTRALGNDFILFDLAHSMRVRDNLPPHPQIYNASGSAGTKARFTETLDPKLSARILRPTLCVRGIHIETIATITPDMLDFPLVDLGPENSAAFLKQRMQEIELVTISSLEVEVFREAAPLSTLFDEFGTTLFRGYNHPSHAATPASRYKCWRGRDSSGSGEEISSQALEIELGVFMQNTQVFVTESGQFGVVTVNCHVQTGDEVFILQGGKMPFIFREEGLETHRLMGPCYLYGAMAGERVVGGWDVGQENSRWEEISIV